MSMEPPADALETTATRVWVDDGIIHILSKGVGSTAATVAETFEAVRSLVGDRPLPVLFDARDWPSGSMDAWPVVIANAESVFTRAAVLREGSRSDHMGMAGFSEVFNRLIIPFEVFADEGEARSFLAED